MKLEKRIEKIEEKLNIKHGCFLLVKIWDGTEGPSKEQSAQFLKHQKESGLCENCGEICVLDWTSHPPQITPQPSIISAALGIEPREFARQIKARANCGR